MVEAKANRLARVSRQRAAPSEVAAVADDAAVSSMTTPAGRGGAGLVRSLFDTGGEIVLDRVADRLGLSKQQLAETMGVSAEAVYRADRARGRRTQARAAEMLEILGRISQWAGGERQALAWYRAEPIPAFGGRTAEALVKDGRAAAVRDYLDHVATGGFA